MKILIVDNNLYISSYPQGLMVRSYLGLQHMTTARIKKAPLLNDADLSVDRVILTGSTAYIRENKDWMNEERRYIDAWMKKGVPILGICFGAQLLARHIFGENAIVALPYPINGSIMLHRTQDSPLFKGLPTDFGVVATHYEGFEIPQEHTLARVDEWPCYAFRYEKNVYGVQFHPELSGPTGHFLVKLQRFMYDRTVYQDFSTPTSPRHGKQLFSNFITST
ncbi:MAG: type 1 glutamine amidotransferase [Candidatus Omnitrophica bacterium]|nr:type 1 glutamine amidotransferase [Candidatus Omnitrophota bacterium]